MEDAETAEAFGLCTVPIHADAGNAGSSLIYRPENVTVRLWSSTFPSHLEDVIVLTFPKESSQNSEITIPGSCMECSTDTAPGI